MLKYKDKIHRMFLEIEQLGQVKLIPNTRARRVIIRFREGEFQVTYPTGMKLDKIEELLIDTSPKLLKLKGKTQKELIFTEDTIFSTHTFDLRLTKSDLQGVYTTLKDGILQISFPSHSDVKSADNQSYIRSIIESCCRSEAKRILPGRVRELAKLHGFEVGNIKINKSRSRWGSCSIEKNINLSYFCMMLPNQLIQLIILHELCHTVEMNHGDRFWALLDKVTQGKSKELTKQLRDFRLHW